jgi:hypothetical protein
MLIDHRESLDAVVRHASGFATSAKEPPRGGDRNRCGPAAGAVIATIGEAFVTHRVREQPRETAAATSPTWLLCVRSGSEARG